MVYTYFLSCCCISGFFSERCPESPFQEVGGNFSLAESLYTDRAAVLRHYDIVRVLNRSQARGHPGNEKGKGRHGHYGPGDSSGAPARNVISLLRVGLTLLNQKAPGTSASA